MGVFEFIQLYWREIAVASGVCAIFALIAAVSLLVVAARQIADVEIPPDADFFETLQHVPITVPLALDLLDLAFDVFAAPISWVVLELLGLQSLQMITAFEGIIPGTQLLPTMTAAWFIARMMKKRQPESEVRQSLRDYQLEQRLSRRRPSLASEYRSRALLPEPDDFDRGVVDGEYYEEDYDPVEEIDEWE